jgi:hypothetical protein
VLSRHRLAAGAAALACLAGPTVLGVAGAPAAQAAPSFGPKVTVQMLKDLLNAWKITRGSGVTVAVLSSGVDPHAVGLAGKVITGHDFVPLPDPPAVSGTVLASAIAGSGPTSANPVGPVGRAPQAKILGVRVYADTNVPGGNAWDNSADLQTILASAIRYAARRGAQVIVVDPTEGSSSAQLEQAVQYAISKNDVVIASEYDGPKGGNQPSYPDNLPGVIDAGTAFMPGLVPATPRVPSPRNESILVSAPGNQFIASSPTGVDHTVQNFYSALAWLAGMAALIKSVYPNLPPSLVARALALSSLDHPSGGYNTTVGFGLINADGALHEAAELSKLHSKATPGPGALSPSARLGPGRAPGPIQAVHHATAKLATFGGAIVVGLICLIGAVLLLRRGRHHGRRRTA